MLHELRVENLLLIERAELGLVPGLNVLTGETGAGKTVLAHALDLLLGGKPRAGIVRPGASEAYVEGVFALPAALRAALADRLPEDADELVLARRVSAEGRTRAYLGGRSATAAELAEIGGALLSFYGQHEHRRLTLASAQLEILDGFCGPEQAARREAFAAAYAAERALREELERSAPARARATASSTSWSGSSRRSTGRTRASRRSGSLLAERERLRHLTTLLGAAAGAAAALVGDDGALGYDDSGGFAGGGSRSFAGTGSGAPGQAGPAADALEAAVAALESAAGVDDALDALAERARALAVEADDLAGELRRYGEAVDAPPGRLDEVEERLALFDRLKRKHGGTIEAVLAHAAECRRRRDELTGAEEALEAGEARLAEARAALASQAEALHEARAVAADGLAGAVRERLAALAMEGATFEARLTPRDGYGPAGGDEVEFLIAPNPGVPAGPLRETASGGELSRVMLALMGVAAQAGPATLVFDEVDAGIGGQTARAVGEQLRELAAGRQIICITHLPQIASLADLPLHDRQGHVGRHREHDRHAPREGRRGGRAGTDAGRRGRGRCRSPPRPRAAEGRMMRTARVTRRCGI